ncbi:MAG: hypothetical protein JHC54_05185 [Acinetobacter sp.]|nr:hypothetical protein [Acinetobacter sp.]
MEKITISNIGPYKDEWAVVYLDPNNLYSAGGGRITVVMDDHVGSAFFSHVGQPTFKEFIAQCDSDYLIRKLFKVDKWVPVENGEEFIEYVARNRMDAVKEQRSTGAVTKAALRALYDELRDSDFTNTSHLFDILYTDEKSTLEKIFGDDWWHELNPTKINQIYTYLDSMLTGVIAEFKKLNEVADEK